MPKVTILIATYNADREKLKFTVKSAAMQDMDDFEIIVADDGSEKKWNREIAELLDTMGFDKYRFADSDINGGTVKNIYNGVLASNGEYVKVISPGDFFYGEDSLRKWTEYIEARNADMCFGDAVYYTLQNGRVSLVDAPKSPVNVELFDEPQKRKKVFDNYMLANDTISGAAMMTKKSVLTEYLEIMTDRIKYAEDYMVRIMVYDGKKIVHIPEKVIWYEHGTGISTGKQSRWAKLLKKDYQESDRLILERNSCIDSRAARYRRYLNFSDRNPGFRKPAKCMMFPSVFYWRYRMKKAEPNRFDDVDTGFINRIMDRR